MGCTLSPLASVSPGTVESLGHVRGRVSRTTLDTGRWTRYARRTAVTGRRGLPQVVCGSRLRVRGTGSERVGEAGEVRYWAAAAVIYSLSSRVVGKG